MNTKTTKTNAAAATTKTNRAAVTTPALAPEFVEAVAQHLEQALLDWLSESGNKDALTVFQGVTSLRYYLDAFKDGTLNAWDEESVAGALPELTKAMAALGQAWRTPGGTVEPGSVGRYGERSTEPVGA